VSNRSSSVLLGAFAVGAVIIALVGALFVAGSGFGSKHTKVFMVFDGSLRGLNVGAPVALRGVTIGQVTDIDLLLNASEGDLTMVVEAELDASNVQLVGDVDDQIASNLVDRGLRAQLDTQSLLTGLLYVQLDFFPGKPGELANLNRGITQIPTIPTELEQLRSSFEKIDYAAITERFDSITGGLDGFLNSEEMQALPGAMRDTLVAVQQASDKLSTSVDDNSARIAILLDESGNAMRTVNESLPSIITSLEGSMSTFESVLTSAESSLRSIEQATSPESALRQQVAVALEELSLAARAIRSLADSLQENPESLLRGRPTEENNQ
jgi:paraquat-inducible protein B